MKDDLDAQDLLDQGEIHKHEVVMCKRRSGNRYDAERDFDSHGFTIYEWPSARKARLKRERDNEPV